MRHRFDDMVTHRYQTGTVTGLTEWPRYSRCIQHVVVFMIRSMTTRAGNELPKLAPAITSGRARIMGIDIVPKILPGDSRSTPCGVGSSAGRIRPAGQGPVEHPTPLRTTGISLEAVSEPQNVPTVEPLSPV